MDEGGLAIEGSTGAGFRKEPTPGDLASLRPVHHAKTTSGPTHQAEDEKLAKLKADLDRMTKNHADYSIRHARTKQSHLKAKIEKLEEEIPVAKREIAELERTLRMRRSARTVATFQMHTQEHSTAPKPPPTLLEQVQQQLEHGRSGRDKKAAIVIYEKRKRKEGEMRAVQSLQLTNDMVRCCARGETTRGASVPAHLFAARRCSVLGTRCWCSGVLDLAADRRVSACVLAVR